MKFRNEYKYCTPFGSPKHIWTCVGRHGAVHLHISDLGDDYAKKGHERFSAGLEFHHRKPPHYLKDDAPSQDWCWLIGAPCWHDGTSLYAHETLVPFWTIAPHDHERMLARLESEYKDRFEGDHIMDGGTSDEKLHNAGEAA